MAMAENTLATELQNLTPTDDEAGARAALADAYGVYAADAVAGIAAIQPANLTAAKSAMAAQLVGMSAPGAGLVSIPAAIVAFWAAAVVPPWPPSVSGTPPPNAGLAALLPPVCAANTAGGKSLEDACADLAAVMHSQAIVGGLMLVPPPPSGTPTPIL